MTEITDDNVVLSPAMERFVLQWGELGGQWGVNRSIAQIHALLLLSARPLTADHVSRTLGLARSNVSTSLKELQSWDLVRRAPTLGDRREHFEAKGDGWEMAKRILEIRKARELTPAATALEDCLAELKADQSANPEGGHVALDRLSDIKDNIDLFESWYDQMRNVPKETLTPLIKLGSKIVDLLAPFTSKETTKGDARSNSA